MAYLLITGLTVVGSVVGQILNLTIVLSCVMPLLLHAFMAYTLLIYNALMAQAYADGVSRLAGLEGRI